MTNYHTDLPSIHEVMTGMWSPSAAESAAGLEPQDFCTAASLIKAMDGLNDSDGDWSGVTTAGSWDQVADGSLGFAFKSIFHTLGASVHDDGYDYTCEGVKAWPQPTSSSNEPLFLTADPDGGVSCVFSTERTEYAAYQEGEAKRCFADQDGTEKHKLTTTRRVAIAYGGVSCTLWEANRPWYYAYGAYACLVDADCDSSCLADDTAVKHLIYECLLTADCTSVDPDGDETGAWTEVTTSFTSASEYRVVQP
jgi:hypothetical protein